MNRADQRTLFRMPGHNNRTGVPTLGDACGRVQSQAAALLLIAMTLKALGRQERPDLRFEEDRTAAIQVACLALAGDWEAKQDG